MGNLVDHAPDFGGVGTDDLGIELPQSQPHRHDPLAPVVPDQAAHQLDPEKFPRIKYSDDVRVPVNTLQLLIKKINEEYVL